MLRRGHCPPAHQLVEVVVAGPGNSLVELGGLPASADVVAGAEKHRRRWEDGGTVGEGGEDGEGAQASRDMYEPWLAIEAPTKDECEVTPCAPWLSPPRTHDAA